MNKKTLLWQIPLAVLLVVGTYFIARQADGKMVKNSDDNQQYQYDSGMVFGTTYSVTYKSDVNLQTNIEAELARIDNEFSMFNANSTVSKLNRGESPELSVTFREVYNLAKNVNRETDGAFDVTVAPLVNAWGFGFKHEKQPTAEQVDSLLKIRSQLDFSAIAKGYGCDAVASLLRHHDVNDFMVEIGGEIVTHGINPRGGLWKIGVTRPTEDSLAVDNTLYTVLRVTDIAMATSGNYRNFYYKDGRRYAHTIDPRTGYPIEHELLSATVLTTRCSVADAYATSFMVLGLEASKALLERHPELLGYFIYTDADGSLAVWSSPGLQSMIEQ